MRSACAKWSEKKGDMVLSGSLKRDTTFSVIPSNNNTYTSLI